MNRKDYKGFENDYLIIIDKAPQDIQDEKNSKLKNKTIFWEYICKTCGKKSYVNHNNVNQIKSCGCLRNKIINCNTKYLKEIGNVYNNLTIISINQDKTVEEYNRTGYAGRIFMNCKCKCGNETVVTLNALKTNHIKSCGCLKKNNPLILDDLTGMQFGRLTVIKRDIERDIESHKNKKYGNAHWLCKCSCGSDKTPSVSGYQLKSGGTQSCGCIVSEK